MTKLCTYILTKDSGLAPNPFWGCCTLAVCAPNRQGAKLGPGDMIAGFRSKSRGHKLVYAMEVAEKIDMDAYFRDPRFQEKRPNLRGSWMERCGDNFYSQDIDGSWTQHRNRFHIGPEYLAKDTRNPIVFIGKRFWYFGRNASEVPSEFKSLIGGRGIRVNHTEDIARDFCVWVKAKTEGIHGLPNDNPDIDP